MSKSFFSYEEMLGRALERVPKVAERRERFEVPKPEVVNVGNRTILYNFKDIYEALNRDPHHLLRFLSKELATAGSIEGSMVIFQGRFSEAVVSRLVERYVQDYVICPVCRRPDTQLIREGRYFFIKCAACGAKSPIRPM